MARRRFLPPCPFFLGDFLSVFDAFYLAKFALELLMRCTRHFARASRKILS